MRDLEEIGRQKDVTKHSRGRRLEYEINYERKHKEGNDILL